MNTSLGLDSLNDQALLSRFGDLVRLAHEGNAGLLRHIEVIDRRKHWAKLGRPSAGRPRIQRTSAETRVPAAGPLA